VQGDRAEGRCLKDKIRKEWLLGERVKRSSSRHRCDSKREGWKE